VDGDIVILCLLKAKAILFLLNQK